LRLFGEEDGDSTTCAADCRKEIKLISLSEGVDAIRRKWIRGDSRRLPFIQQEERGKKRK